MKKVLSDIVPFLIGAVIWFSFSESTTQLFDIFMSVLIGYGLLSLIRYFQGKQKG
jgi:hypothetical protein